MLVLYQYMWSFILLIEHSFYKNLSSSMPPPFLKQFSEGAHVYNRVFITHFCTPLVWRNISRMLYDSYLMLTWFNFILLFFKFFHKRVIFGKVSCRFSLLSQFLNYHTLLITNVLNAISVIHYILGRTTHACENFKKVSSLIKANIIFKQV